MKFSRSLMVLSLLAFSATAAFAQAPALTHTATPAPEATKIEIKQGVKQDLVFKDADVKETVKALGKSLKVNVVFDESVRIPHKLDLELNDVTAETALKVIFIQQKLRAFLIDGNTVYVHADNPQIKERFGIYPAWTPKSN
jgi:type II secretory pathway component GspD/PulD (secretin)